MKLRKNMIGLMVAMAFCWLLPTATFAQGAPDTPQAGGKKDGKGDRAGRRSRRNRRQRMQAKTSPRDLLDGIETLHSLIRREMNLSDEKLEAIDEIVSAHRATLEKAIGDMDKDEVAELKAREKELREEMNQARQDENRERMRELRQELGDLRKQTHNTKYLEATQGVLKSIEEKLSDEDQVKQFRQAARRLGLVQRRRGGGMRPLRFMMRIMRSEELDLSPDQQRAVRTKMRDMMIELREKSPEGKGEEVDPEAMMKRMEQALLDELTEAQKATYAEVKEKYMKDDARRERGRRGRRGIRRGGHFGPGPAEGDGELKGRPGRRGGEQEDGDD